MQLGADLVFLYIKTLRGKISKACDALAEIFERIIQFSALQDVEQSLPVVHYNLDKDFRKRVSRIPEFDAR